GRYGDFIACSGYPECRNTRPIVKTIGVKCPRCGKDIVEKRSRRGKIFYGCSGYPECDQSYWNKPVNKQCPKCGSLLVEKVSKGEKKLECSNKECDYKE
ncbi:MAG: topoisomerase DNA-binding C4 zinc finger domain-containing protein, partial [Clostridiales bacterium]|nr:topoisomerase DNA-binding C4 zinc finger domain-containing protein [Clostridiales bacterium]